MSEEPTVALVFSPEAWVEALHHHLSDHGGARVRQVVVEPSVALDEEYDTLVVSHAWPALTSPFVQRLRGSGRSVLGVHPADEPAAKEHLVRVGVDATVAADATPSEFVAVIAELGRAPLAPLAPSVARTVAGVAPVERALPGLTVVSGARGAGVTEVALAFAAALARRGPTVLVDAHEHAPSLAVRLCLSLGHDLASAIDACVYEGRPVEEVVAAVPGAARLAVLPGVAVPPADEVEPRDLVDLVVALSAEYRQVVVEVEVGPGGRVARALLGRAERVVGVGAPDPAGVARLFAWRAAVADLAPGVPVWLAVNRAPRDRFRRAQLGAELGGDERLAFVPTDDRVAAAAWNGETVREGAFTTAMRELVDTAVPVPVSRRGRTAPARRWRW
jgi:MinD-like ATPase involved in chromosome partitioning or flagellar assembly